MEQIANFLHQAKENKIIDDQQYAALDAFNIKLHGSSNHETEDQSVTSESPRLIRGFHDILISIGIYVTSIGIGWLFSIWALIPLVIILSEIFIKRQNLALPAFVLTGLLMMTVASVVPHNEFKANLGTYLLIIFTLEFIALSLFYWRYRVPIALACLITSSVFVIFLVTAIAASIILGIQFTELFEHYPRMTALVGLIFALTLFAIAMRYDSNDRTRVTRGSDIGFWLHLVTAPLLLNTTFLLLLGDNAFLLTKEPDAFAAIVAISIIAIIMLIGIVIDRRAFVTAGLISLGISFYALTWQTGFNSNIIIAISLVMVGIIVLSLGSGWQVLRKMIVSRMPENIKKHVPAA